MPKVEFSLIRKRSLGGGFLVVEVEVERRCERLVWHRGRALGFCYKMGCVCGCLVWLERFGREATEMKM